ncbi:MAG TPA: restriction endonuclease subunit S [Arcobacter sp.]|nr:restriction endonuclease subunit S [Arcobacter sp.]
MFEIQNTFSFNKDKLTKGTEYDYVTRTSQNQGILQETGFVNQNNLNKAGCWSLGLLQMDFFYRERPWYAGQFVRKVIPKIELEKSSILFFTVLLNKQKKDLLSGLVRDVDKTFLNAKIQLPIKDGEINFAFIENFIAELEAERIAELEAYLVATNLKDYTLTKEEQKALDDFANEQFEFDEFNYKSIFNKILQGRRLTKENQISGDIPFVMAGVTNTGVVNYISNPVASFPKNSITIDIFGNTFYRDYDFGAGDDTGVYWNDEKEYSKEMMLFLTTSMKRSIFSKFNFGKKLRSSQSLNFKMKLPTKNNQPNYELMETFISAIQKLVIKDVVLYADEKINATKRVVEEDIRS